jgi:hypothetical protein
MTVTAAQINKRALLIGVNEYPNLPDYSQLRGCVNDALDMKHLLETAFGFPPANISVLKNEQATEKGIRAAMEKLIADCAEGDIVVFHFSGHGSQMTARGDKPRGYDESIMPYDSGRMNPTWPKQVAPCDIRDTEINEWLSRLSQKTPYITLIFDSCHSGSITRMVGDTDEEGTRLRWVPPDPLPQGTLSPANLLEGRGLTREAGGSGWLPLSDKYVLLAACAAEQGAYEYDNQKDGLSSRNGAFTFFLIQEINRARDKGVTYRDIWEKVAIEVNSRFKKQTPLLEGTGNKLLFDVRDFEPMNYLLVTERTGDEVQLAGGAIHGLTTGSRWDIYPAGTRQLKETKEERQGIVEITTVKSINAGAQIIEEIFPQAITPPARAVEVLQADPERLMPVRLVTAPDGYEQEVEKLRQELAQSRLLEVTDSHNSNRTEIKIVFQDNGAAQGVSPSPDNFSAEACWSVQDLSEFLLMPLCPVTAPESVSRIRENLETIWRYEKVLKLRNEQSKLKGKIDFILLKKGADGNWQEVSESEEVVYKSGELIAFRVINHSDAPVHISVLDLGLSKRIDVLYPPSSASEAIAVKRSGDAATQAQTGGILSVGEGVGDQIELFFPENLTFRTLVNEGGAKSDKEFFKLIVTTKRHDLSFLRQSGIRNKPHTELEHPLEKLMYLASTAGLTREARINLLEHDDWLTIERSFSLQQQE